MKKNAQNETTKNTAKTMIALFHVPARVALALQHGDGNLADWCAELLCGGWNTDMDDRETAKWAAYVRKKFGCTEDDGESIAGVCAGFVDAGSHEESAVRAVFAPPVRERNKIIKQTGEEVARKLCMDVLGRSSFTEDKDGPAPGTLGAVWKERDKRLAVGFALCHLAQTAASLIDLLPQETPEAARFKAVVQAFIDAETWFAREQVAVMDSVEPVLFEGVYSAAAVK